MKSNDNGEITEKVTIKRKDSLGYRLELLRDKKGLTQADLAREVNIKRETVNQWESNRPTKTIDTIVNLAKYFHVSCDYLLRGIKTKFIEVHEATGLSDDAISNLNTYRDNGIPKLVESILTTKFMPELMANLSDYLKYRDELRTSAPKDYIVIQNMATHDEQIKENVKDNRVVLSAKDAQNYFLQRTLDIINEIIRKEL